MLKRPLRLPHHRSRCYLGKRRSTAQHRLIWRKRKQTRRLMGAVRPGWLSLVHGVSLSVALDGSIVCHFYSCYPNVQLINCDFLGIAIFQEYYQNDLLKQYTTSEIAWIPSLQVFFMMFSVGLRKRLVLSQLKANTPRVTFRRLDIW